MEKEKRQRNPEALGIAGFTLGVMSLVMMLVSPPIAGILTAIVGTVLCLAQQKKHKTRTAKTGLILNVLGVVLNAVWWVLLIKIIYPFIQERLGSVFPSA
ncbi:MAG: hypothetical protein Q7S06_01960 [Nanoarchaeota archaeon]|nr:hypothetical protein [Nanoarchaeota archaeon]